MSDNTPDVTWSASPPDEEDLWWFYGDESYGNCGGHYSGSWLPEIKLQMVRVIRLGGNDGALTGVCDGRFIPLRPVDMSKRCEGYYGVWLKADVPPLPDLASFNLPPLPANKNKQHETD